MLRVFLTVLVFLAVVAGTTWVVHNLPSYRAATSPTTTSTGGGPPGSKSSSVRELLNFPRTRAIWSKDDQEYVREYERETPGHYDFLFENKQSEPIEICLSQTSCDCTSVNVALVKRVEWEKQREAQDAAPGEYLKWSEEPAWNSLDLVKKPFETYFSVPVDSVGVVRISWAGKKETGSRLRLGTTLGARSSTDRDQQAFLRIEVPVVLTTPVQVDAAKLYLGVLGPKDVGKGEFLLWSSTRENVEVGFKDLDHPNDPLLIVKTTRFSPEECKSLETTLKTEKKIPTRVLSAMTVKVEIHEQREGKQLDQGTHFRVVSFTFPDGTTLPGPTVWFLVKGDYEIGATEDRGRLDLKTFPTSQGIRKSFTLWSDAGAALENTQSHQPAALSVKLEKDPVQTRPGKTKWKLQVEVPPGGIEGPFPETSVIILRIPAATPRFLRIPIMGNASQG